MQNVENFPIQIHRWLNERGLTDATLTLYGVTFDLQLDKIVIPIYDGEGKLLFHKYRKNPFDQSDGPKYTYDKGGKVALYNLNNLKDAQEVIICEGEFDCMILGQNGFTAVTSTGGATSFQKEWAGLFYGKKVYVCFDNDKAGDQGKLKVCKLIPFAKNLPLPKDLGEHGDITDYFKKYTVDDFKILMEVSRPYPEEMLKEPPPPKYKKKKNGDKITRAKDVPISSILKVNRSGFAKCPFHKEKTPSLKYYKEKNRFYCFGCGKSGDTIDLIMQLRSVGLPDAIKILIE